jgi:hypothetical protein
MPTACRWKSSILFFALPKIGRAKKMLPLATACRLPNVDFFLWERLSSRDIEAGSSSHRKTISLPHGMAACSLNHPHPASPVKGGGEVNVEKMQMQVPSPCGRCQGHQR